MHTQNSIFESLIVKKKSREERGGGIKENDKEVTNITVKFQTQPNAESQIHR